jgi:hypothetical protein
VKRPYCGFITTTVIELFDVGRCGCLRRLNQSNIRDLSWFGLKMSSPGRVIIVGTSFRQTYLCPVCSSSVPSWTRVSLKNTKSSVVSTYVAPKRSHSLSSTLSAWTVTLRRERGLYRLVHVKAMVTLRREGGCIVFAGVWGLKPPM